MRTKTTIQPIWMTYLIKFILNMNLIISSINLAYKNAFGRLKKLNAT